MKEKMCYGTKLFVFLQMMNGLITELQPSDQEQLTDRDEPDNLDYDEYGDEQMEEDNNDGEEGGYKDENYDLDDDFFNGYLDIRSRT